MAGSWEPGGPWDGWRPASQPVGPGCRCRLAIGGPIRPCQQRAVPGGWPSLCPSVRRSWGAAHSLGSRSAPGTRESWHDPSLVRSRLGPGSGKPATCLPVTDQTEVEPARAEHGRPGRRSPGRRRVQRKPGTAGTLGPGAKGRRRNQPGRRRRRQQGRHRARSWQRGPARRQVPLGRALRRAAGERKPGRGRPRPPPHRLDTPGVAPGRPRPGRSGLRGPVRPGS